MNTAEESQPLDCPWCGSPVTGTDDPCANCNRAPSTHPSMMGGADSTPALALELDFEPATPARSGVAPSSAAPPGSKPPRSTAPPRSSGPPRRPSGAQQRPMALELDDDGGAPASGAAPGSGADIGSGLFDDDDDFDDMQIGFGDEDEMFGPTSGGPTSRRSQVPQLPISSILPDDISPEEVDALADYGPAPSSAFAAIGYAFRVRARRAELTELLEREHAIHDTKLNNILTGIAGMLAPLRKLDHPRVQGILAMTGAGGSVPPSSASTGGRARPVRSSTSHGDRRELAMKAEKDAVALQGAEHDEAVLTEDLKKLETKIRRLYKQAREQAGADAKVVPKEFAGPIRELTAEGKALKPKLVEVSKRVAELRKRAALSKAKAEEANREVQASSEAKRDDPDGLAAPEMTEDEREAKRLDDCDRALRRIMAELPRLVDGEDRARVASYDIEAKHLITKLELQQRALDAFDAEAERRGNVALAVLTGILVVLIAVGTQLG